MKKYMTPSLKELTILNNEMLCVSGDMDVDTSKEVNDGLARKGGWNSENWTDTEDTED